MRFVTSVLLLCGLASAQSFQGSLRGRVIDPKGAAIGLAKITLVDEGTSAGRATITSDQGEYTFAAVTPSTYTVIAEAPGFKRAERHKVLVSTQTAVTVDLAMELGEVTEHVNVTAEAELIQTADASTGQVIDRQKLVDLPNLGRNPFMMSKLSETVVQVGNPKFNRMQDQSGSSQISIAGGPVRGNNYTLDGISITDSTNRAVIIPTVESVQEMKVQANTYDAEMGRTGGGTFNTFLRSGTNEWHGSAFGYTRQTGWVANNFFSNRAGQAKPDQPFFNYGGSIGGPVIVPKLYNGRNRTFFFVTGEAYRQFDASGTRLSVPTALERKGDFSQSLSRAGNGLSQVQYDPLSTMADGTRTPFAGNVLPAGRISPVGLALASYYPLPNVATAYYGAPNFDSTVRAYNRADQVTTEGRSRDLFVVEGLGQLSALRQPGTRQPLVSQPGGLAQPGDHPSSRGRHAGELHADAAADPGGGAALGLQPLSEPDAADQSGLRPEVSRAAAVARRGHTESRVPEREHGRPDEFRRRHHQPGRLLFAQFQWERLQVHGQAQPQGRVRLPLAAR